MYCLHASRNAFSMERSVLVVAAEVVELVVLTDEEEDVVVVVVVEIVVVVVLFEFPTNNGSIKPWRL